MRRVLILAYFFPPMAVTGAIRPASFCANLRDNGYWPRVIAARPSSAHPPAREDVSTLQLLPDDIEPVRLNYLDRRALALRIRDDWLGESIQWGGVQSAEQTEADYPLPDDSMGHVASVKRYLVERLFMFPDQQKDWSRAAIRFAISDPECRGVDLVYATGSPWSALLAGAKIARKLGVPYVADFRDPWSPTSRIGLDSSVAALAKREERRVVRAATRIVANTEALRRWFVDTYSECGDKFVTVTNGFNRPAPDRDAMPARNVLTARSDAPRTISYFGPISKFRMPSNLIRALSDLFRDGRVRPSALKLKFYGAWSDVPPALEQEIAALVEAGLFEINQPVEHSECAALMAESDYALLLQNGFPLQVPAKAYEYIGAGTPILYMGSAGAAERLVADLKIGVTCANETEAIRQALIKIVNSSRPERIPASIRDQFDYVHLTKSLAATFDDAIASYSVKP